MDGEAEGIDGSKGAGIYRLKKPWLFCGARVGLVVDDDEKQKMDAPGIKSELLLVKRTETWT
jgi:hypothetical protein